MTTLLFARHGQASFGQDNYDKLSDLGIRQTTLLGTYYGQANRRIDAIITGTLARQRDSAKHFMAAYSAALSDTPVSSVPHPSLVSPLVTEGFDEFNHQDVLLKSDPKLATQADVLSQMAASPNPKQYLAERFNLAMQRWHSGEHDGDYIESWRAFNQRVQAAVHEAITVTHQQDADRHTGSKTVLIVTSGGVIASIAAKLLIDSTLAHEDKQKLQINHQSQMAYRINRSLINSGVTAVTVKNRSSRVDAQSAQSEHDHKMRLLTLNEHNHLYLAGENYLTWY